MLNDLIYILKELRDKLLSSRLLVVAILYSTLVFILFCKLFNLQIINGETYQKDYVAKTEKTVALPATRGNIYDVNGNLLAYNKLAYAVTIQDNGYFEKDNELNLMIYNLVKLLHSNNEQVIGSLEINLDDNGNFYYTGNNENAKKRFLKDLYQLKSVDELDNPNGKYKSTLSAAEVIDNRVKAYKLDKLVDENENSISLTDKEKLDIINIRYTMILTGYKKYEATKVASAISETTKVTILENMSNLKGVNVEEENIRVYNDSIYFSSVIGYIGKVNEEKLKELLEANPDYTINDSVGRSGIEEYMESTLRGTKGSRTMFVDNVGHIMEVSKESASIAGNDVYLTIDRELQIGIYHIIEQQLAGILVSKIVNQDEPNTENTNSTNRLIPVKDAYFQLINNNILNMDRFSRDSASDVEKNIYAKFLDYKERTISNVYAELTGDGNTKMSELGKELNAFMYYIYTKLSSEDVGIIIKANIDENADYFLKWKADDISMKDFIYTGIAGNWIDVTKLDTNAKYSDAASVYNSLVNYTIELLKEDREFYKLMYKYMIKQNVLSGNELCLALYEQGVLAPDELQRQNLSTGDPNYAYLFLIDKIRNIELTPAQLALDPCTAGVVITDSNTGEVKALVSYPGYDNNRLANVMDVEYYNSLDKDQSFPMYNNATQAQKAPGSTFKPISAVAGLEEKVISPTELIKCTGRYDVTSPPIKCWIFPGYHGDLDMIGAIQNSCNYYFTEIGHRLSTTENNEYSTSLGLERIAKYATLFGLNHKSGVELIESEPVISNELPEQSAIGQGTHLFTNVQLARYISAVANRGNVFELSLLDNVKDRDGNIITEFTPKISSHIDIDNSTWDYVQLGMRQVVKDGSAKKVFRDLDVEIAGKTGTTQETKSRANHAFFVSFAPYSNPEITLTVNIPFGYSSSNAALIAKNTYKLYFGYTDINSIINSKATPVIDVNVGD